MTEQLPERLQEIVADFSYCQGQEKLEYLLEYAEKLPPSLIGFVSNGLP
ncbi:MAG: hypothetical protein V9G20_06960 [Candidatus Promineifilaceae bacterium]